MKTTIYNQHAQIELGREKTPVARKKPTPLCTSNWCTFTPKNGTYNNASTVKLNAKLTDVYCPDCGHALLWE